VKRVLAGMTIAVISPTKRWEHPELLNKSVVSILFLMVGEVEGD
jgi:hypothetical protein